MAALLQRVWSGDGTPPAPAWVTRLWKEQSSARKPEFEGRTCEESAVLWFIRDWSRFHSPYRLALPRELIEWLNAPALDVGGRVRSFPGFSGSVPNSSPKPVSRMMHFVCQQDGRTADLKSVDGYYNFLAYYVFTAMPESNLPGTLLPAQIIHLLNVRIETADVPMTLGMLLCLRRSRPDEYKALIASSKPPIRALGFWAMEELLSLGDPRLIPLQVSSFWRTQPLGQNSATAFEYAEAACASRLSNAGLSESGIRDWFQSSVGDRLRGAQLMSGPPSRFRTVTHSFPAFDDTGVVIYRDHQTLAGLSRAGLTAQRALEAAGVNAADLHFSLSRQRDAIASEAAQNENVRINARRKCHLLNINPEYVIDCFLCNLPRISDEDYIIGQFYWELSSVAEAHRGGIAVVDEIWTASTYLSDIYSTAFDKPVITMGQAVVAAPVDGQLTRSDLGFSPETCVFLSSFDATSIIVRKNPLGAVLAFRKAFPKGSEPVALVIKTRNLANLQTLADRRHWQATLDASEKDSRVRILDCTMSDGVLGALYRLCDCFVSLHRSEGFGFGPAEAMINGRPVIVTNYSGVRDFCTPENSRLVDYSLVRVRPGEYPYLNGQFCEWADPSIEQAAEHMRELAEDRALGKRLGQAAGLFISENFSIAALSRKYLARLRILGFA